MASDAVRRRRFQFDLKSLMLLILLIAVTITWWRQWKQVEELALVKEKLKWSETNASYFESLNQVFGGLDMQNPKYQKAFELLKLMNRYRIIGDFEKKSIGNSEVVIFHSMDIGDPGSINSFAAILYNHKVIDMVIRTSNSEFEFHEVSLQDIDNDGKIELVFDCRPGEWESFKPFQVAYKISEFSFKEIAQPVH